MKNKSRTTFPGGTGETGKNTIAPEHGKDTTAADRGPRPFDEDTFGTDSATFDTEHPEQNVLKSCGPPTIYGYEDYTGVSFHVTKQPDAFAHGMVSMMVSTEYKSEEEYTFLLNSCIAKFGDIASSGRPCAEPTKMSYLTVGVAVSVTNMFTGMATYMGDPKADHMLTDGEFTDTKCPVHHGLKGASSSTLDSMNTEAFGYMQLERETGKIPEYHPDTVEGCATAVIPVSNTHCTQQTVDAVTVYGCSTRSQGCSTSITVETVKKSGHPSTFKDKSADSDKVGKTLSECARATIMGMQGEFTSGSMCTVNVLYWSTAGVGDMATTLVLVTFGNEAGTLCATNNSRCNGVWAAHNCTVDAYALGYVQKDESKSTSMSMKFKPPTFAYGEHRYPYHYVDSVEETGAERKNTPTVDIGDAAESMCDGGQTKDVAFAGVATTDGSGAGDTGSAASKDCKSSLEDGPPMAATASNKRMGETTVLFEASLCGPAHAKDLEESTNGVKVAAVESVVQPVKVYCLERLLTKNNT